MNNMCFGGSGFGGGPEGLDFLVGYFQNEAVSR